MAGRRLERASALYDQARKLAAAGQREEAVRLLRESADLEPHFKTLEVLGELLLELGRPREAVVPLAAATALNAQVRAPSLLARALLGTGNRIGARHAARIGAARDPNNRIVREVLAATDDLAASYGAPLRPPDSLDGD